MTQNLFMKHMIWVAITQVSKYLYMYNNDSESVNFDQMMGFHPEQSVVGLKSTLP